MDYGDFALAHTRDEFAVAYSHPFLFCHHEPAKPSRPQGTDIHDRTGLINVALIQTSHERGRPWVLPVKKVRDEFPSMITVGRTRNNDLILEDAWVSKLHAYFRAQNGRFDLTDCGSRNGTFVGGKQLAKGAPHLLSFGDVVRFGQLTFRFLNPEACWASLVQALDEWDD
jgi:hypothetical protein